MDQKEQVVNQIETKKCIKCNLDKELLEYNKGHNQCKLCYKASQNCQHGKRKFYCKECGGNGYCPHGIDKRFCLSGCKGNKICEHNITIYRCLICNTNIKCIHNKNKNKCNICNTNIICSHNINRQKCKICNPNILCEHGKIKRRCRLGCGGQAFCIHGTEKTDCLKGCSISAICPHGKHKKRCIVCNPAIACQLCKSVYVTKNTRYYPLCEACFSYTNPGSELVTAYKVKERYLSDTLKDYFKDMEITLTFDKKVDGGCSKRRPDVFIDRLTHTIVVECDENQHKNYECENKRTMELFQDLGRRPMVLIRFNPDSYTRISGEKQSSCFKPLIEIDDIHRKKFYNIEKQEWARRLDQLIPTIQKYIDIDTFPNKEITIETLFYNNYD